MSGPVQLSKNDAEVARYEMEATRARAEAGKAIVAIVFRSIVSLGAFGIALGATAVVIQLADPSLHLAGLLVIWTSATLLSVSNVVVGLLEKQGLNLRRLMGNQSVELQPGEAKRLMQSIQE
jgi:hypothetical protein